MRQVMLQHDQEDRSLGRYTASGEGLEIFPGDQAYGGSSTAVRIEFDEDGIESIVSLADESLLEFYDLEPRLITHLFDKSREKRRLIRVLGNSPSAQGRRAGD